MSLTKISIYCVVTLFIVTYIYGGNDSVSSTTVDKQAQCMGDPTTHFNAGLYQQKYPNLSKQQIAYILCK